MGWAWIDTSTLAALLGAGGYWLGGAAGAALGVAAGVGAPLLVERATRKEEAAGSAVLAETAGRRLGPAALLDPALGVVPFAGRAAELAALERWCRDGAAGPVRLVTGGGGAGKTRLALELCARMAADGWRCAQVSPGREAEVVAAERAAAGSRARLLVVVDYAEARSGLELLVDAARRDGGRVRVLLVARQAGDWSERLGAAGQAVRAIVAEAGQAHQPLADAAEPGVPAAEVAARAVPWFAGRLGVPAPGPGQLRVAGPAGARVLDLHAAALVAVLQARDRPAGTVVRVNVREVLEELLGHERHYWRGRAEAAGLLGGPDGLSMEQLGQLVAAGALLGAATRAEAAALAARVPGLGAAEAAARWRGGCGNCIRPAGTGCGWDRCGPTG